jgi:DNA/RNA-binding domain of Phe-tRNA-synthetase-like protein
MSVKCGLTSERYQNDILKVLIKFSEFVECNFDRTQKREEILAFNSKKKRKEDYHDERWITTWNDYLWRIKYFCR